MTPELKPELKPCPFCGNATATELIAWDDSDWVNHDFGGGGYVVICSATPGAGGCGSTTGWSESAQDAIDAWNHRPAADIDLPTQERNAAELAFGLSDEALRIADYFDTGYGHFGERKRAAALLRQQHAEIERLTQQFDPDTHAHRPDCCGPQIDTHCLGCTTAEGDAHAAEIARLTAQVKLLRYALVGVVGEDSPDYLRGLVDGIAPDRPAGTEGPFTMAIKALLAIRPEGES